MGEQCKMCGGIQLIRLGEQPGWWYDIDYYTTLVMPLNYDSDQLYDALSAQCLGAADRVMGLLESQDSELYNFSFKILSEQLKPLIMADHEVGLEARKNIISGMVQRTPLQNLSIDLHEYFTQLMNTSASAELLEALTNAADGKSLLEHVKSFLYEKNHISDSCFYGKWMDGYPLFEALETVSRLDHEIIMYCIGNQKNTGKSFGSNTTVDRRRDLLIQRLEGMNLASAKTKRALTLLSSHPRFIAISDHLFALDYEKYQSRSESGPHRKLFDQTGVLSQEDLDHVKHLRKDLIRVWNQYQTSIKQLRIEGWAHYVAQRSMGMFDNMKNASEIHNSETHTIDVENAPVFVDFSKNIEKHRDTTSSPNGKQYGSVSN